jgi:hypothetical protein
MGAVVVTLARQQVLSVPTAGSLPKAVLVQAMLPCATPVTYDVVVP